MVKLRQHSTKGQTPKLKLWTSVRKDFPKSNRLDDH